MNAQRPGRLYALFIATLSVFLCSGAIAEETPNDKAWAGYPRVWVDLQAGVLLDPVPFDTPLILSGQVPASVQFVTVEIESFSRMFPVVERADALRDFERRARALLDSTWVMENALNTPTDMMWFQNRLAHLLVESMAQSSDKRTGGRRAVAPATIFDPNRFSAAGHARLKAQIDRIQTADSAGEQTRAKDALIADVMRDARRAQIGFAAASERPRIPIRWSRLQGQGVADEEEPSLVSALSARWNRLENRVQPPKGGQPEEGTLTFNVLVPPLDVDRFYVMDFAFERVLTEPELQAFKREARRRFEDAIFAGKKAPDWDHLRIALAVSMAQATGGGRLVAPGSLFDPEAPQDRIRSQIARISAPLQAPDAAMEGLDAAAAEIDRIVRGRSVLNGSVIGVDTKANRYVGMDIGLIYAGEINEAAAYLGINLYLRPVNKGVPLRQRGGFARRFSLTIGLTLQGVADARGTRENLFYSQALILGAGYRLSQHIRAGLGVLLFRERDPETFPLTLDTRAALTPYVSVSFDMDASSQLGKLFRRAD